MRIADVEVREGVRAVIARLTGELDLSNAGNVSGALAEAIPNSVLALIVDLTDVEYLDSAGIHLIYELREKLRTRGQVLRLVIPTDSVAGDALRLAGVTGHVESSPTVDAALAGLE